MPVVQHDPRYQRCAEYYAKVYSTKTGAVYNCYLTGTASNPLWWLIYDEADPCKVELRVTVVNRTQLKGKYVPIGEAMRILRGCPEKSPTGDK